MGPAERTVPCVRQLMEERGTPFRDGNLAPLEVVYQANTITRQQYESILREWDFERRADRNRDALDAMDEESALMDDRMVRSRVPKRFIRCSTDHTRVPTLDAGRWLYVCGNDVERVTRCACSHLKGWLAHHDFGTALFERSSSMLATFRDGEAADVMSRNSSVGLLLLSGLGAEYASEWAVSRLNELLDRRYGAMLPTIITTRHQPVELAQHLGNRSDVAESVIGLLRAQSVLVEV